MLIIMDLEADFDWIVRQQLLQLGLHQGGLGDCFAAYVRLYEYHLRRAIGGARRVFLSLEVRNHPEWARRGKAIREIRDALEAGQEIAPYLSKGVDRQGEAGRDRLALHWGIYHVHLSPMATAQNGFVARADYLLLVYITREAAYLVDIAHHDYPGLFEEQRWLEVLYRNWPDLLPKVRGVLASSEAPRNAREIRQLRRANVNAFAEIGGHVLMPTTGVTSAGTPTQANMDYMRLIRQLNVAEQLVRSELYKFFPECRGIARIRLERMESDGVMLHETVSGQRCFARW